MPNPLTHSACAAVQAAAASALIALTGCGGGGGAATATATDQAAVATTAAPPVAATPVVAITPSTTITSSTSTTPTTSTTAPTTSTSVGTSAPSDTASVVTPLIAQIQITGTPVKVFDHARDQQETYNIPDGQVSAWREADGTVDLMIPSFQAYRMRGADLHHLAIDPKAIYSSLTQGGVIAEASHDYHHWFFSPYTLDGKHIYTVAHSEWYACLLTQNCDVTASDGNPAEIDSWSNTLTDFASTDGGATWQLNNVASNHVVADTSEHWTGSSALAQQVYLHALNHSGMFQPTHLVQEGGYWYSVAEYIHRDFSQIDPANGVWSAPVDGYGYVLIRTADFTNPNGWQVWTGAAGFAAITDHNAQAFLPQSNGQSLNAAPGQLVYDTNAKVYVLMFELYSGGRGIYYMTSASLANPAWTVAAEVVGSETVVTDPGGALADGSGQYAAVSGFNGTGYPSILDPTSTGFNFEFSGANPDLFFSTAPQTHGGNNTARDLYRVQLSVTYQ